MPNYFDFHSHIAFPEFKEEIASILAEMEEKGIETITVGTDSESSVEAVHFARQHHGVYATIGLHPADNTTETFDEERYQELVKDPSVVMVGECGLDYFHEKTDAGRKRQEKEFEKQIEFAVRFDKPLMLHVRNAHNEALALLESKKKTYGERLRGDAHFFTGTVDEARRYYDLGFYTSFPGVITFATEYDDVVRFAPKEFILSETDSPYATPAPHRGKKNNPTYVPRIVEKIAELRGQPLEEMREQLVKNAYTVLGL